MKPPQNPQTEPQSSAIDMASAAVARLTVEDRVSLTIGSSVLIAHSPNLPELPCDNARLSIPAIAIAKQAIRIERTPYETSLSCSGANKKVKPPTNAPVQVAPVSDTSFMRRIQYA